MLGSDLGEVLLTRKVLVCSICLGDSCPHWLLAAVDSSQPHPGWVFPVKRMWVSQPERPGQEFWLPHLLAM